VNVAISNPIPDITLRDAGQASTEGNRMALNNIRSRLEVLYGSTARLDTQEEAGLFVTTLSYPYALDH